MEIGRPTKIHQIELDPREAPSPGPPSEPLDPPRPAPAPPARRVPRAP